jgi:hypothetical protein
VNLNGKSTVLRRDKANRHEGRHDDQEPDGDLRQQMPDVHARYLSRPDWRSGGGAVRAQAGFLGWLSNSQLEPLKANLMPESPHPMVPDLAQQTGGAPPRTG